MEIIATIFRFALCNLIKKHLNSKVGEFMDDDRSNGKSGTILDLKQKPMSTKREGLKKFNHSCGIFH